MHTQPNHDQMISNLVVSLTALLRSLRMPFVIAVQDLETGNVTSHSYCPVDSNITHSVHVHIDDGRGVR